jgi:hypothetical protein
MNLTNLYYAGNSRSGDIMNRNPKPITYNPQGSAPSVKPSKANIERGDRRRRIEELEEQRELHEYLTEPWEE